MSLLELDLYKEEVPSTISTTCLIRIQEGFQAYGFVCFFLCFSLLVHINHFLHLVVAPQEDPRAVVDVFRHDGQHAIHVAVNRLSTG